jgi:hypothetical protein
LTVAKKAAEDLHLEPQVREFVSQYGLESRPMLEIGSGRGYLQDVAKDYTGLDIRKVRLTRRSKPGTARIRTLCTPIGQQTKFILFWLERKRTARIVRMR